MRLTELLDFDVKTMLNTPYRTDIIQDKYFVIDSFEQLYHSLPEINRLLAEKVALAASITDKT